MTVALLVAVVNSTMDLRAFPWQYFSDVALHLDWPSVIERCESHVVLGTSIPAEVRSLRCTEWSCGDSLRTCSSLDVLEWECNFVWNAVEWKAPARR